MKLRGLAAAGVFAIAAVQAAWASDWVRFGDASVGFEGLFPAAPEISTDNSDGITMKSYASAVEGVMCFVGISDYKAIPSVEAELQADRDNFAAGVKAKVTSSTSTTFAYGDKALPAIAFDAESAEMRFRSIALVDGLRVAQVVGAVAKGAGDDAPLDRCVKSFKLLP